MPVAPTAPAHDSASTRPSLWDHDLRRMVCPPLIDVVPDLLQVGATIIYAAPGLGKTFLAQVVEHWLAYGTPMAGWEPPDRLSRCLVVDFESDLQLAQERSFAVTPRLTTDDAPGSDQPLGPMSTGIKWLMDEGGDFGAPGLTGAERFAHLRAELAEAQQEGNPYRYVRIDTLRLFCGGRPRGMDVAEWDNQWARNLNKLAIEFDCAIPILHHTNKNSEYSGSTGIGGGVTTVLKMEKNADNPHEILLKSEKIRRTAPFEYALIQNSEGVPQFTDTISPAQAGAAGTNRAVIDVLTARPRTMAELCAALYTLPKSTVRRCVQRLQRTMPEPTVRYYKGVYEVCSAAPAAVPDPEPTEPPMVFCAACRDPLNAVTPGQTLHPWCKYPDTPHEPESEETVAEIPGKWNAFTEMKDSIASSTRHPIRFITLTSRQTGIWPMFDRSDPARARFGTRMAGAHTWVNPAWRHIQSTTDGALVAVLDHNGSYPSACSSVTVAPNLLRHTGPLKDYLGTAGIYMIKPFAWTDPRIGHPLGSIADDLTAASWAVTTPHMQLLMRLHRSAIIAAPVILDSYTGKPQGNLFAPFSASVRKARNEAHGTDFDEYIRVKRSSSQAIRSLWSDTKSPFWRPDWWASICAEASVRHWARAYSAVLGTPDQPGATLLRLSTTDESWLLAPAGSDDTWAPAPYKITAGFGGVKHKTDVGVRLSPGADIVKIPSPVSMIAVGRTIAAVSSE